MTQSTGEAFIMTLQSEIYPHSQKQRGVRGFSTQSVLSPESESEEHQSSSSPPGIRLNHTRLYGNTKLITCITFILALKKHRSYWRKISNIECFRCERVICGFGSDAALVSGQSVTTFTTDQTSHIWSCWLFIKHWQPVWCFHCYHTVTHCLSEQA